MSRILKPELFDFKQCLWFLDRNLDDCMHQVTDEKVRKLISYRDQPLLFEVSEDGKYLNIEILYGKLTRPRFLVDYVTEWFDMDRNIRPFYKLLKQDKDLLPLLKYRGFHIVGIPDLFETLCWCVIGQQINLPFAYKVKRRLVEIYGQSIEYHHQKYYVFPAPEVLQLVSVGELRSLQITTRKAEYIIGMAKLFASGELSKQKITALKNDDLMREELLKVRGIGEWTANYALMKSMRAMNCIPYGDSGVNNALFKFKGVPKKNNRTAVDKFFGKYDGWKTYLVFYFWRSLREKQELV